MKKNKFMYKYLTIINYPIFALTRFLNNSFIKKVKCCNCRVIIHPKDFHIIGFLFYCDKCIKDVHDIDDCEVNNEAGF